jgi:predicted RNA binding protein YcfA (HicA-like mRNA interferase family)
VDGKFTLAHFFCSADARMPQSPMAPHGATRDAGRMKVGDVLRLLREDGWLLVATRGSHRQFKHPSKPGRVTVAGKPGDDLAAGTLASILKQATLKR